MAFAHRSNTGAWKDFTIGARREIDPTDLAGKRLIWTDLQFIKRRSDDGLSWIHVWPQPTAQVSNRILSVGSANPDLDATNVCGVKFSADGQLYMRSGNSYTALEKWLIRGSIDAFYIRGSMLNSSLAVQGFALDTWHPATQSPEWFVAGTRNAPADAYVRFEVAKLGTDAALVDTNGDPITDANGAPLTIAGAVYEVLDTADIGLRAGI